MVHLRNLLKNPSYVERPCEVEGLRDAVAARPLEQKPEALESLQKAREVSGDWRPP